MTPRTIFVPKLAEAIVERLPNISREQAEKHADRIYQTASTAASVQWLDRNDLKPADEIRDLEKASKQLDSAAQTVSKLGWHGGGAVQELAQKLRRMDMALPANPVLSREHSIEVLSGFLAGLSKALKNAADSIEPDAPSINQVFGHNRPAGRPAHRPVGITAEYTAKACRDVFEQMTKQTASVSTNALTNEAYGAFLDFVADVFSALELNEDPETWARRATKD